MTAVAQHAEDREQRVATLGFALTDLGNAERLVARWRDSIRYCPPRRRWLVYDGKRWAWDETGVVVRMMKRTVRAIYDEAGACEDDERRRAIARHARESERGARIRSAIDLAATEQGMAVMPTELDADPWLLNVDNGTLDLRSGDLRDHDRRDMITKLAPVAYEPAARLELWERFLAEATGGDAELVGYLQRVAGYCLTGQASERKFFFLYGPPGTAKSTFIDALAGALGDYHRSADFGTWLEQTSIGGNRGDLVRLAGARLVTSVEVRKGKRWDEALIKRITGGDEITAAAKFEAEVTFRASFKLLLAANDAPAAREDDAGLWARMQRVPFVAEIPDEKRDPTVKARLSDPLVAGPAVLAWAMRGCIDWQASGVGSTRAVERSTAAYRSEVDLIGGFLSECCVFDPWDEVKVTRTDLRRAFEDWCSEQGIRRAPGAKELTSRLREAGAIEGKSNGLRVWKRVRLLGPDEEPQGSAGTPQGHVLPSDTVLSEPRVTSGETCPCPVPRDPLDDDTLLYDQEAP